MERENMCARRRPVDKKAIINLAILSVYALVMLFYLYELFWGCMNTLEAKGVYYTDTVLLLVYLLIADYKGHATIKQRHFNFISKGVIIINFTFIAMTLFNILPKPVFSLLLINGSIFVVSILTLTISIYHDFYKN